MSRCGEFLRNCDIRLIANDFPIESKVFRRLTKNSLSARHCLQSSHTMRLGNQTLCDGDYGMRTKGHGAAQLNAAINETR
jgi:hypothetical protein